MVVLAPLNIATVSPPAPLELSPGTYTELVTDTLGDVGSDADGAPAQIADAADLLEQLNGEAAAMNAEADALSAVHGELDAVAGDDPSEALAAADDFVGQQSDGIAGSVEPGVSLPDVPTEWKWRGIVEGGGGGRGAVLQIAAGAQLLAFVFKLPLGGVVDIRDLSMAGEWPNWDSIKVVSRAASGGVNTFSIQVHSRVPLTDGPYLISLHGNFVGLGIPATAFSSDFLLQVV